MLDRINFRSLVWPIFVDNLLRILALAISYGLVARISDTLVAVLGVINLYLLVGFTLTEGLAHSNSILHF